MHHFSCICGIYQEINHHPLNFQTIPLDSTSVASSVFLVLWQVSPVLCMSSSAILVSGSHGVYLLIKGFANSLCRRHSVHLWIWFIYSVHDLCWREESLSFSIPGRESIGFTRAWVCDARWRRAIIYLQILEFTWVRNTKNVANQRIL